MNKPYVTVVTRLNAYIYRLQKQVSRCPQMNMLENFTYCQDIS